MVDKVVTVGYVPRLMKDSRRFTAVIVASTIGLCLLILTDWFPYLRGPQPDTDVWHWMYALRPYSRWWLVGIATLLFGGLTGWWMSANIKITPKRTGLFLVLLAGAALFLQLSLVFADRGAAYTELVDRALAVQTNGYFWHAAQVENLGDTLRNYPAQMTQFESDHVRTHPPGLLLANWQTIQIAKSTPLLDPVATAVQHRRCTDLWLLDNPPHISVALGIWAILPAILAVTAVFPAYLVGYTLTLNPRHAIVGAVFAASVPSLLIFTPTPDQLSAVMTLWLFWVALHAIRKKTYPLFFLAGVILSIMSFVSLGNAVLLLLLIFSAYLHDIRHNWIPYGLIFGVGASLVWLIYWATFGVAPWEIAFAGLAEHETLVLSNRNYGSWLLFNGLDLLSFLGLPILIGFVALLFSNAVEVSQSVRQVGIATAVLLLILNFSGSVRGEVGRIWLFIFPLMATCAGLYYARKLSIRQIVWAAWSQLLVVIAVGLAWQPIEGTIVVAERPLIELGVPQTVTNIEFENGIVLTGTSLNQRVGSIDLTLFWQSEGGIQRPYTVFNHLVDSENNLIAQSDGWSMNGQWPTSCWSADEIIPDPYTIKLPSSLPVGEYRLLTGFYDAKDLTRLSLAESGETAVFLTYIHIEEQ